MSMAAILIFAHCKPYPGDDSATIGLSSDEGTWYTLSPFGIDCRAHDHRRSRHSPTEGTRPGPLPPAPAGPGRRRGGDPPDAGGGPPVARGAAAPRPQAQRPAGAPGPPDPARADAL